MSKLEFFSILIAAFFLSLVGISKFHLKEQRSGELIKEFQKKPFVKHDRSDDKAKIATHQDPQSPSSQDSLISFLCDASQHHVEFNETIKSIMSTDRNLSCFNHFKRIISTNTLKVSRLGLINIEPIAYLKSLEILDLNHNQISDLSPLRNLKNLKFLKLANNLIEDISDIEELTKIEQLDISNNQIETIEYLSAYEKLEELKAENNKIDNVYDLKNIKNLRNIQLSGNTIAIDQFKTEENCPKFGALSKVLVEFCTTEKIYTLPTVALSKSLPLKISKKNSGSPSKIVFPANAIQVWAYNYETVEFIIKVLKSWIKVSKNRSNLSESKRINNLFLESLESDSELPSPSMGVDYDELFFVAITNNELQGVALLDYHEDQNKVEFLSVAPHNIVLLPPRIPYKYVGTSLVEKIVKFAGEKIFLTPGSVNANKAYLRMGFLPVLEGESLEDLGDAMIDFQRFNKMQNKLNRIRSQNK